LISILNISLVVNNCRENIVCLIVGQLNAWIWNWSCKNFCKIQIFVNL
jgi:hypothetical protein